jgi:hypothetical protein
MRQHNPRGQLLYFGQFVGIQTSLLLWGLPGQQAGSVGAVHAYRYITTHNGRRHRHGTYLRGSRALACCCGACCCCCCMLVLVCVALCEVLPCAAAGACCLPPPLQGAAGTSASTSVGGGCMSSSEASCAAALTDDTSASGCLTLPGCVASLRCCCCCCSCMLLRSSCLPLSSAAACGHLLACLPHVLLPPASPAATSTSVGVVSSELGSWPSTGELHRPRPWATATHTAQQSRNNLHDRWSVCTAKHHLARRPFQQLAHRLSELVTACVHAHKGHCSVSHREAQMHTHLRLCPCQRPVVCLCPEHEPPACCPPAAHCHHQWSSQPQQAAVTPQAPCYWHQALRLLQSAAQLAHPAPAGPVRSC